MFKVIGGIFRYSLLVLTVLVLSQIIQIRGVSISHHVERALDWIVAMSPSTDLDQIKKSVNARNEALKAADAEISPDDQKKLERVIQTSR